MKKSIPLMQKFRPGWMILNWLSILFAPQLFLLRELMKAGLRSQGRYTIGTIQSVTNKSGNCIPRFSYVVKDRTYTSREATLIQGIHMLTEQDVGKQYFVLFNAWYPAEACLLPLNLVSNFAGEIPTIGWSSIPE